MGRGEPPSIRPATRFEMGPEAVMPAASWSPVIPSSEVFFGGSLCSRGDATALFMAQGDHGVDAHRAPRGNVAGCERDEHKKNHDGGKCERVHGADTV